MCEKCETLPIYLVVRSPIGIWKTPAVCTRSSVMPLPLQQKVVENYRGPSLCHSLGHTYEALYPFRCSSLQNTGVHSKSLYFRAFPMGCVPMGHFFTGFSIVTDLVQSLCCCVTATSTGNQWEKKKRSFYCTTCQQDHLGCIDPSYLSCVSIKCIKTKKMIIWLY